MPHLITDTIDEPLVVLLITKPSVLSAALTTTFIEKEFSVKTVSFNEFREHNQEFLSQNWYKIIILFDHSSLLEVDDHLLSQIATATPQLLVVYPLTTAIEGEINNGALTEWLDQTQQEYEGVTNLARFIDLNQFIFYLNPFEKDVFPLKFLVSRVTEGLLQDPVLQLSFSESGAIANEVVKAIVKPRGKLKILKGLVRKSSQYTSQIQDVYEHFFQKKLTMETTPLTERTHPLLIGLSQQPQQLELLGDVHQLLMSVVQTLPLFSAVNAESSSPASDLIQPNKQDTIKQWNDVKKVKEPIKIDESINSVFSSYRTEQKTTHIKRLVTETKKGEHKIKSNKFLFGGGLGVAGLALGLLVWSIGIAFSNNGIKKQLFDFLESHSQPATSQEKKLNSLMSKSRSLTKQVSFFTKTLSLPLFPKTSQTLSVTQQVMVVASADKELTTQTQQFFQEMMGASSGDSLDTMGRLHAKADQLNKDISLLLGQLKEYETLEFDPTEKELFAAYTKKLEEKQHSLTHFQQLYPLLPTILGSEEKRVYAVLLQNEQELRPTGGFIQAIALLTFDKGKLTTVLVKDIYSVDQQLSVFIDPPNEIKQFLGETRWFTRDSNWNPDFPQAAKQVTFLIEKSLNQSIDGVIAINSESLGGVIQALDEVALPEYNEVVTAQNLDERLEFNSEIQLVDKDQRPEYSELLLTKVIESLKKLSDKKINTVLSSLEKSAQEKELLVYLSRAPEQGTSEILGWSGSMVQPTCPPLFKADVCVVDALFQVEANIGVNKANYYLQRQTDHTIQVTDKQILHKRVITLKNTAQTNAWPKGPYRAFTRLYGDPKAVLADILVNGVSIKDKTSVYQENNRQVWSFTTETAVQQETQIEVRYALPHSSKTPFTYVFFDQKQPGARDSSPRVFLSFESHLTPTLIAPQADVQGNVIIFNPSKDTGHMFVGATFK